MLKRIGILFLVMIVVSIGLVWGHGAGMHVFGTVTDLDADRIVVQKRDGKTVSISVRPTTKYRNRGMGGSTVDLKIGDRVVVDVTQDGDGLIATEVQFASFGKKKGS